MQTIQVNQPDTFQAPAFRDPRTCIEKLDQLYYSAGELAMLGREYRALKQPELSFEEYMLDLSQKTQKKNPVLSELPGVLEKCTPEMGQRIYRLQNSIEELVAWERTLSEEAREDGKLSTELVPLLDSLFRRSFLLFLRFYFAFLECFAQGRFNPTDEIQLLIEYHYHLGFRREALVGRITEGARREDEKERATYLILFQSLLEQAEKNPTYQENLLDNLCKGELQIIKVHISTEKGRRLLRAKALLLDMLKNESPESRKALRFFETLDFDLNEMGECEDLPANFLEKPVEQIDLLDELDRLFPDYVGSFPLDAHWWGSTTLNGTIMVESNLLTDDTDAKLVRLMLLLFHEIAHKKKNLILKKQKQFFETPENLRKIWGKDLNKSDSTGKLLEKTCFGRELTLQDITENQATALREKKNWESLNDKMKGDMLSKVSSFECTKMKQFQIEPSRKCGSEPIRQGLIERHAQNKQTEELLRDSGLYFLLKAQKENLPKPQDDDSAGNK